jgi:hypothetical protein
MTTSNLSWQEANQRFLATCLAILRRRLEAFAADGPAAEEAREAESELTAEEQQTLDRSRAALPGPSALDHLQSALDLSPFERDLVLLCAGVELDGELARLVAAARGGGGPEPTFGLALSLLPGAHWSALSPASPPRRWRLLELKGEGLLTARPLRIDERILHFLVGVQHLDERLVGLIQPAPPATVAVPSHRQLAAEIAAALAPENLEGRLPGIQLVGTDPLTRLALARAAAAEVGLDLAVLRAHAVPTAATELEGLVRLWEREAALSGQALLLDCDDLDDGEGPQASAVARFVDEVRSVLFLSCRDRRRPRLRPLLAFDVAPPTAAEQSLLWRQVLGQAGASLDGELNALVGQFRLDAPTLLTAARQALAASEGAALGPALWAAARRQSRPRLAHLAQPIDSRATWEDLVLPEEQRDLLRDLATQVRHRFQVYEDWGFAAKSSRGLGISALFAGVSGTGKTMAAEVLANELGLDLYRIDLASVISKYIGETEKNLRLVFDAAEGGGAVLLFDEADALFGKRTEVKDSHDRHANVEISYLLQRMESYRGLAILTTNLKNTLDTAFLRRLRFVIEFPFPDPQQRQEIWRRIFPAETPSEGLEPEKLARLHVAGGNIRNIALSAAFTAADEGSPVRMEHVLRAARTEYRKLERPLNEAEIRGWVP